jgi:hypothetical protein
MQVPEQIIEKVKTYRSHGDIANIVTNNPELSRYEVQQVLAGEDSSPEAIAAVAKYYQEKEDMLSDFLN